MCVRQNACSGRVSSSARMRRNTPHCVHGVIVANPAWHLACDRSPSSPPHPPPPSSSPSSSCMRSSVSSCSFSPLSLSLSLPLAVSPSPTILHLLLLCGRRSAQDPQGRRAKLDHRRPCWQLRRRAALTYASAQWHGRQGLRSQGNRTLIK